MAFSLSFYMGMMSAHAHGAAQWIQDGGYRDSGGVSCCSPRDCSKLESGAVTPSADGWVIRSRVVIPYGSAQPSIDGGFWICVRPDGEMRCFFAPVRGM